MKMKKLAVVAYGWNFPLHYYKSIAEQKVPNGWEIDFFCVAHRKPDELKPETFPAEDLTWDGMLSRMDNVLYKEIATVEDLKKLGFNFLLEENIGGELFNLNQWGRENNFEDYDVVFTSHDDTFIVSDNIFVDVLEDKCELWEKPYEGWNKPTIKSQDGDWLLLSNSIPGTPEEGGEHPTNRFDFWKKDFLKICNNKNPESKDIFDIPKELNFKEGGTLSDLNKLSDILVDILRENDLAYSGQTKLKFLSPYYGVSIYAVEGDKGTLHGDRWGYRFLCRGLEYHKFDFDLKIHSS